MIIVKKLKRRVSVLMLLTVILCMCNFSVGVYAAENCKLTFRVGYLGNNFSDDLTVNLKDIASSKTYQFVLKASNGYGASEVYKIAENTTYEVTITFPNSDKFEVKNADGTDIKKINATASGLELYWQIKEKKAGSNDGTLNNSQKNQDVDVSKLTGEEVLNDFFQKVDFIKDDSSYNNFINNWASATYKEQFIAIKGNSEDKWNSMSKYEQACYSVLVTYPRMLILGVNSNVYAKDKDTFLKNLEVAKNPLLKLKNGDIVYNSIVEVWEWHWNNWTTSRVFKDPYEGTSYSRINADNGDNNNVGLADNTKDDGKNLTKELSSKDNFLNIIKEHILSILILLVVGIVLGITIYKNRKKNIDDNIVDN